MAQDQQVGLEIRPPVAVEKNHPKKTGGGKWCCDIPSPFQISWKQKKVNQTVQQHHKTVAYFRLSVV
jgi:hypothetical protein